MKRQMHVRRALLPALVMAAFALAGCGNQPGTTTASGSKTIQLDNPGPPAETINGEEVPMRLVDAIIHQRSWDPSRQDLRERALKEVTNIVLTAQAAAKEKFTADPDFAAQVELGRLQALSNATAAAFRERGAFDEAAARADYEKRVVAGGKPDYDFTQIVMRTQPEAAKVMADLKVAIAKDPALGRDIVALAAKLGITPAQLREAVVVIDALAPIARTDPATLARLARALPQIAEVAAADRATLDALARLTPRDLSFLVGLTQREVEDIEQGRPATNRVAVARLSRRDRNRLRAALKAMESVEQLTRDLLP